MFSRLTRVWRWNAFLLLVVQLDGTATRSTRDVIS